MICSMKLHIELSPYLRAELGPHDVDEIQAHLITTRTQGKQHLVRLQRWCHLEETLPLILFSFPRYWPGPVVRTLLVALVRVNPFHSNGFLPCAFPPLLDRPLLVHPVHVERLHINRPRFLDPCLVQQLDRYCLVILIPWIRSGGRFFVGCSSEGL
jgi:hypothetical protein